VNTHVLVIGSYSAKEARHNWGTYSIGKAAQEMIVNDLKKESKNGLNVSLYYPGAVDTDIYNSALSQSKDNFPDQAIYQIKMQ
jgi:short-subunit dehydrogenase